MADSMEQARNDADVLKEKIKAAIDAKGDTTLADFSGSIDAASKCQMKLRRTLKGHLAKIYALHWADDERHVVSASQDGKLLVWDAISTNKVHAIPLRSSWVMTVGYSPTGNFVACGGLDNICSVFNLASSDVPIKVCRELSAHNGFLSCCRFINDSKILTSSGDNKCFLWDIDSGQVDTKFEGHARDVMSLALSPDKKFFVSGACDAKVKVWDISSGKCQQTFSGHESDINSVAYFPNGNFVGTGSDDATCRLFSIASCREMTNYHDDDVLCGITSVAFSISGRYLFAGYDDCRVRVWDTIKSQTVGDITGHEQRVSCLGVTNDGMALCTGSWDQYLKVWA